MTTTKLKLMAMAAVGVAALLGVATAGQQQPAEDRDAPAGGRWEYRVVQPAEFSPAALHRRNLPGQPQPAGFEATRASLAQREELLNDFGADGWELVEVGATELIFKRRK